MDRLKNHADDGRENKHDDGFPYALVVAFFQLLFAHEVAREDHEQRHADAEERPHHDREEHPRSVHGGFVARREEVDDTLDRSHSLNRLAVEAVVQEEVDREHRKRRYDSENIQRAVTAFQFREIHIVFSLHEKIILNKIISQSGR